MALDDLRGIAEYFLKEGRVIKDAPIAFALGVAIIGMIIFGAVEWHYSGEISSLQGAITNQQSTLDNQRAQIGQLQEELKGTSPQLAAIQANRDAIRSQLQQFYVAGGALLNRALPKDISNDDFAKYVQEYNDWASTTGDWIGKNMGPAAEDRFFDQGDISIINWGRAVNPGHNGIINLITVMRKNLSVLIETAAWDGSPTQSKP